MTKEEKVIEILKRLYVVWPEPQTELNHTNALELLIATMLSAQTTDKVVNEVTATLFQRYKTAKDYALAEESDIYTIIKKVNFSKTKATNVKKIGQMITENFGGKVPKTMDELITLPGVARKTANVVLGDEFNIQSGIVVDTHVMRLSLALGLTDKKTPEKIEKDLMEIVPKDKWKDFSNLLILFGRYKCPARMNCKDTPELGDLVTMI